MKTDKRFRPIYPVTLKHNDPKEWSLIDIPLPVDQNIVKTKEEKVKR